MDTFATYHGAKLNGPPDPPDEPPGEDDPTLPKLSDGLASFMVDLEPTEVMDDGELVAIVAAEGRAEGRRQEIERGGDLGFYAAAGSDTVSKR